MDQTQREAFEAEWAEMSDGIAGLFDSKTRDFIKSCAYAAFSAGAVYGCRAAYGHALAVTDEVAGKIEGTHAVG